MVMSWRGPAGPVGFGCFTRPEPLEPAMPAPDALYHWTARVQTHFPRLTPAQAALLALASFGLVLARSCGLTAVAGHLARLLGRHPNTLRQRLREIYQPARVQSGR